MLTCLLTVTTTVLGFTTTSEQWYDGKYIKLERGYWVVDFSSSIPQAKDVVKVKFDKCEKAD